MSNLSKRLLEKAKEKNHIYVPPPPEWPKINLIVWRSNPHFSWFRILIPEWNGGVNKEVPIVDVNYDKMLRGSLTGQDYIRLGFEKWVSAPWGENYTPKKLENWRVLRAEDVFDMSKKIKILYKCSTCVMVKRKTGREYGQNVYQELGKLTINFI